MDPTLPGFGGLAGLAQLHHEFPEMRFVLFGRCASAAELRAAFRAGASAYVLRNESVDDLAGILDTVSRGEQYVSPRLVSLMVGKQNEQGESRLGELTEWEIEVLRLIGLGTMTKEIARTLMIRPRTVGTHRTNIMRKLGIHTLPKLVRFTIQTGLARPD